MLNASKKVVANNSETTENISWSLWLQMALSGFTLPGSCTILAIKLLKRDLKLLKNRLKQK